MRKLIDSVSMGEIVKTREQLLALEVAGKEVFRFESGNPSFSVKRAVKNALIEALEDNKTAYVPNAGIPELKNAIIEKVAKDNIINITPADVFVTNGAMHALYCVFQTLLDPRDEVIIPDPMWSEIADNIVLAGGVPIRINIENYVSEIEDYITDKTKAVFINSPHNPTGLVLTKDEIINITQICAANKLKLIVDEAYEHINFISNETCANIIAQAGSLQLKDIIFVYSFSKSYSMPGLRLGYTIIADKTLHQPMQKLLRCSVNGINSLSQWAGVVALKTPKEELKAMSESYKLRGMYMYNCIKQLPNINPIKPQGAFYLWVKTDFYVEDFIKSLIENGIGVVSGKAFGRKNNAFRLSFACPSDAVINGLEKIEQIVRNENNLW